MPTSRRRLLTAAVAAVIAGGVTVFVATRLATVGRVFGHIGDLGPLPVALGVLASTAAIVNRGLLNQAAHRAVGLTTDLGEMTRTASVGFAAQKIVKSAGLAGLTVFLRSGRRHGHAAGPVVAACLLGAVASFAALGVVLSAAIVVLAATGRLTGWWIGAAIGFGAYAVFVTAAITVLLRSRRLAERAWDLGSRAAARVRRRDRRGAPSPLPDELLQAVAEIRRRPGDGWRVLAHAVLSKLFGALILAASASAAGLGVGLGTALVVYATVLAASMVSIVPGGVGVVEGSATAMFVVVVGGSAGAAALAVALFRLLDLWLPVVTGAVMARGELRSARDEAALEVASPAADPGTDGATALAPVALAPAA